MKSTWDK